MTCIWSKIFNNNIQLLGERFPQLYKILEPKIEVIQKLFVNAEKKFSNPDSLEVLNFIFPFWEFLTTRDENITVKENGVLLHSSYSPIKESQKLFYPQNNVNAQNSQTLEVEDAITKNDCSWIFASCGLGYNPIEFLKLGKKNLIIIIEPSPEVLFAAWSVLDWSLIFNHNNCIIITDTTPEQAIGLLEKVHVIDNNKIITNNSQTHHQEQWFKIFFTLLERNKQKQIINENTLKKFSNLWLKNSAKNLKYFSKSCGINIYKNMLQNKIPAIVCAAGPTLQNILPHLKELQKKAVIICVDTALRALLRYNIEPDFIILIDPQYYAAKHILGLKSRSSVLVTESSVYPSVLRFECRKIVFTESLFPLGQYFEKKLLQTNSFGKITAGGSVSTTAWDFAKFIGAKKIFVAGLDLGYPQNITHIKGSTFEEISHSTSLKIKPAENNLCSILFNAENEKANNYKNKEIITDKKMKLFAWWFETQIAKNPEIQTFTLSEESLKIPGINYIQLSSLQTLPDNSLEKENIIKNAEKNSISFNINEFNKALSELKSHLDSLYQIAKEGLTLCQKILLEPEQLAQQNAIKSLPILESLDKQILDSNAKNVAALVFPTQSQLSTLYKNQKQYSSAILNSIASSQTIYTQLLKAIKLYKKYL